jgi:hypothetical protein
MYRPNRIRTELRLPTELRGGSFNPGQEHALRKPALARERVPQEASNRFLRRRCGGDRAEVDIFRGRHEERELEIETATSYN